MNSEELKKIIYVLDKVGSLVGYVIGFLTYEKEKAEKQETNNSLKKMGLLDIDNFNLKDFLDKYGNNDGETN